MDLCVAWHCYITFNSTSLCRISSGCGYMAVFFCIPKLTVNHSGLTSPIDCRSDKNMSMPLTLSRSFTLPLRFPHIRTLARTHRGDGITVFACLLVCEEIR